MGHCCHRDHRYEMSLVVTGNTLKLYPTIRSIISDPNQLRSVIKVQQAARAKLARRRFYTLRAHQRWKQLEHFHYGKRPTNVEDDGLMKG